MQNRAFVVGFALAALFGVLVNGATYFVTRRVHGRDGFEHVGYPFAFRRFEPVTGLYEFDVMAFFADVILVLLASAAVGFGLSQWCSRR